MLNKNNLGLFLLTTLFSNRLPVTVFIDKILNWLKLLRTNHNFGFNMLNFYYDFLKLKENLAINHQVKKEIID